MDDKPAAYPAEWNVVFEPAGLTEDTEVPGFLKLWVAAEGAADMDLFADLTKTGGALSAPVPIGSGQQRVSLRELDERSTDWLPISSLRSHQFLAPGEVVPVEISLRATFLVVRAGEVLTLDIGGTPEVFPAMGPMPPQTLAATDSSNEGAHLIRAGGSRDSFLQIPTLPTG